MSQSCITVSVHRARHSTARWEKETASGREGEEERERERERGREREGEGGTGKEGGGGGGGEGERERVRGGEGERRRLEEGETGRGRRRGGERWRGEGVDRTPSHETFSNTFILVDTSHCGSRCRKTCLHKTCSSTCHHMSERLLFPCFVFFLCLSCLYVLSHF